MTISPDAQARPSWFDAMAVYFKPRVLIVMFLGFSSGLPLALSGATLLVWMRESGVDLGTIGLFALVGTPYTVKFLWAPLTDALDVPVLSRLLGRRRGWLVFTQILLMAAIVFLGSCNPAAAPRIGRVRRTAGRDRFGDAGHRGRCLPRRKLAGERAGRRHGLLRRRLSHRHADFHGRRAVSGERHRSSWFRQTSRLALGLCGDGRAWC